MSPTSRIIQIITSNKGKAEEYKNVLGLPDFKIEICPLDIEEIQADDLLKISKHKLEGAIKAISHPKDFLLIDDVSLNFDAMGGFPGPYIKWLLHSMKVDEIVQMLTPISLTARATCLIGLYDFAKQESFFFQGHVKGEITSNTGQKGFGWDSIFKPENSLLTFGQMDEATKNKTSHRALAVNKLRQHLIQT